MSKTLERKNTIVYIDEIHRLNKTQLDIMLPHVEKGDIILICSTTQNPYFCLVPALNSRLISFEFKPLSDIELAKIVLSGVKHYKENGKNVKVTNSATKHFINMANGDARKILSALEFAVDTDGTDSVNIDLAMCMRIVPNKHVLFDKTGDAHFDYMSAIQGAIQASDVHGAIFFLAKSINSGEKIEVICRRLLVTASEDVGCCNPMAAVHTYSCIKSAIMVGLPEASIILSSAVAYLAMQPRSKSAFRAIHKALKIDQEHNIRVPDALKDCHYSGAEELGRGAYQDGHDIGQYIRVLDDLFIPENGDEVGFMDNNSRLWEERRK
jgi:putative ATPase